MTARRAALRDIGNDDGDRLLIEAAQKDRRRFAEVYESNFERVYAFIVRRVGDRDEAQDLTSEVFHRALTGIERFEWRGVPLAAWLLRIAANAIVNRSQRAARERQMVRAGDPEPSTLEDVEQRVRLFRLVDRLPADQRRVIVMRFGEDRSIADIAGALGRSEGAVKQLQLRGLQNLRERLGEANG